MLLKVVDFPFPDFHEINKCYCIVSTSSTKLHSDGAENVEGGEINLNDHTKYVAFIALFFTPLAIIMQHY
jgi:hypothetical protein